MPEQRKVSTMTLLGVLFTLIAIVAFVAILRLKSLADTSVSPEQHVQTDNAPPTVGSILVEDADTNADVTLGGFTPYEGTTHDIRVTTTLHDDNGCKDISAAMILMHLGEAYGVGGGAPVIPDPKPVGKTDMSRKTAWGGSPQDDPVLLALEWHATPVLTAIYPNEIAAGCNDAYITLVGEGFDGASVVKLDGETVYSYYSSYENFLYATLPAAAIINPGTHSITVYNPPLNGGTSDPITLTVLASGGACYGPELNPVPVLTGLDYTTIGVGCDGFDMLLEGTGFNSNSVVKLDGEPLVSSYNPDLHALVATVPTGAIAEAGAVIFTVENPAPVGGVSDPYELTMDLGGSCPGAAAIPVCDPGSPTGNYCYPVEVTAEDITAAGCTVGQTDVTVTKTISVQNYADATDAGEFADSTWTAEVWVLDQAEDEGADAVPFEVNSLAGLWTLGSIDYGIVQLDDMSTQELVFKPTGNRDVHSYVRANGNMTSNLSGYADIPVGNVGYSLESGVGEVPVSTTDTLFEVCVPQQEKDGIDNIPEVPTFWTLTVPPSGVNGTYQNTLTLTAEATVGCEGTGAVKDPFCGDLTCNGKETSQSCPEDCSQVPTPTCGDGLCETKKGEDMQSCPQDCGGN